MTSRHPFEYGSAEISKVTLARLMARAEISELDAEILYLRLGEGWLLKEIAHYIGQKYYGRSPENPLWIRAITYRLNKTLRSLRKSGPESDLINE